MTTYPQQTELFPLATVLAKPATTHSVSPAVEAPAVEANGADQPTDAPAREGWQESIPAQVFLNYFFAMRQHLSGADGVSALAHTGHFLNQRPAADTDHAAILRHLQSSWSTEYALRSTAQLGDEDYLRHTLHWTFPQAYYAVFSSAQALLLTQGVRTNSQEVVRREVGRLVVKGFYPDAVGFYAAGHYGDFRVHRLPMATYRPGLRLASKELEVQAQLGQFLRTTRTMRAKRVRSRNQADPATAVRSARTGEVLLRFDAAAWQQLTWRIGYTTFFDLMARLPVSASHREIERFVVADIDFTLFHQSLLYLVDYLNGIHEAYVAKAVGADTYARWMEQLPAHLRNGFVTQRWQTRVAPLVGTESGRVLPLTPMTAAA